MGERLGCSGTGRVQAGLAPRRPALRVLMSRDLEVEGGELYRFCREGRKRGEAGPSWRRSSSRRRSSEFR